MYLLLLLIAVIIIIIVCCKKNIKEGLRRGRRGRGRRHGHRGHYRHRRGRGRLGGYGGYGYPYYGWPSYYNKPYYINVDDPCDEIAVSNYKACVEGGGDKSVCADTLQRKLEEECGY